MKNKLNRKKLINKKKLWASYNFHDKKEIGLWESLYRLLQIFAEIDLEEENENDFPIKKQKSTIIDIPP